MDKRSTILTLFAVLCVSSVSSISTLAATPDESLNDVSFQNAPTASNKPWADTAVEVNDVLGNALQTHSPQPAAVEAGATSPNQGGTYRVQAGDSLSAIARRLLGDPRRYQELVRLNGDRYPSLLKNPSLILVGWELLLPGSSPTSSNPPSSASSGSSGSSGSTGSSASSASSPTSEPAPMPSPAPRPAEPPSANSTAHAPVQPTPAQETGEALIGPNSRVLHIGDSHTVGAYGNTIDELMRKTGAQVSTYGVAGSSPSWWWNGTTTRCGYSSKDAQGHVDRPADWRTPRQTPDFQRLIAETRPSVIVISLGANMIGASDSQIQSQCQRLCEMAKASGAKIVWVGPPDGREDRKPTSRQTHLYDALKRAVTPYGTFVDSRPYTDYPESGGDGVHYGGTEGTKRAKAWAASAFNEMQRPPRP